MSSSATFKVFVVDDDPVVRDVISAILDGDCLTTAFESAEDCLKHLQTEQPDFFLLDVNLPGMDGYELCRIIKNDASLSSIPVTFVSSRDTIEERIKGYDAGGEDFIVKPFEPEELLRKLRVAQGMIANQKTLATQVQEAEQLSSLVIASMDETGILLQFMSKLIAIDTVDEVANESLEMLRRFGLEGVIQTRVAGTQRTISANGTDLPLEMSIIEHVRTQGRIFEFSRRSVHNFERITLMVNNTPIEDAEFCGRLRDHLSVAAQGIDARLSTLELVNTLKHAQAGIRNALESIGDTIMELQHVQKENTDASTRMTVELQKTLLDSFYRLGLTDNQERFLQDMVGDFMNRMSELLNRGSDTQTTMHRLSRQLEHLRDL